MDSSIVFEKTAKGEQALRHRDDSLPADLRMVLLIINGIRNVETIQLISDPCRDSLAPLFFLEDNGYIQRIGTRANVFPIRTEGSAAVAAAPEPMTQRFTPAPTPQPVPAPAPIPQAIPQAIPQPAPVAMAQPVLASANASVPAPMIQQMDNSLALKIAALRTYLVQTLGQDADPVIARVSQVKSQDEYVEMVKKLYAIIRDYAGVRDAERFMQRFEAA
jgi:hypothetical protein